MSASDVDVLVVGYGAAGASAALAAHATGASVRIVEKTSAGGGNCRHSGGFLCVIAGPGAVDHLDALCFGKTDRAVLEAYAHGTAAVPAWLHNLGGETMAIDADRAEWCWPAAASSTTPNCVTPICRCRWCRWDTPATPATPSSWPPRPARRCGT
jgi:glycine/D-amino acid oxidase-like deaminating enzyme